MAICSTLNSWIGELVFWCHEQVTNKQTRHVKLVIIGQKFGFVVSELVVGSGEQNWGVEI